MRGRLSLLILLLTIPCVGFGQVASPAISREVVIQNLNGMFTTNQTAWLSNMKAMGTNAAPVLIELIGYEPTQWEQLYQTVYAKAPAAVQKKMSKPTSWNELGAQAGMALVSVPENRPYMRELLPLLQSPQPDIRHRVVTLFMFVAGALDKPLLLELLPAMKNEDPEVRREITIAIGRYAALLPRGKAALEAALQDPDDKVKAAASWALLQKDKNHAAALALLRSQFSSTNASIRFQAAADYVRSDSGTRTENGLLPIFISSLYSSDIYMLNSAPNVLSLYGNRASNAVPHLQRLLTNSNNGIRREATNALRKIDPLALVPAKP